MVVRAENNRLSLAVISLAFLLVFFAFGKAWAETIVSVWSDYTPGNAAIYIETSVDGGATWSAPTRLTDTAVTSSEPWVDIDGSNIHVVWVEGSSGENGEIFFMTSADGGLTWSAAKNLSNNAGDSISPVVSVNGSDIYVSWSDNTPGNREIFFRTSADNGATWSAKKWLTNNSGGSSSL